MDPEALDLSKLKQYQLEGSLVTVEDGDTITVKTGRDTLTVRLAGLDAPEVAHKGSPGQQGAMGSIALLTSIVNKYRSQLQLWLVPGETTHGRAVGVLTVGKMNVNLEIVKAGLATSYMPKGGNPGIRGAVFQAAERKAVSERRGLFSDATWRAVYALNRSSGDVTHNALVRPEKLANNWAFRVRNRAIAGLRSSDASDNSPNAFPGMKPDRPDFPGGRVPFNLDSMALIQKVFFLDVETTGLKTQSVVTQAALHEVGVGKGTYFTALRPGLKTTPGGQHKVAAMAAYEHADEVAASRHFPRIGSGMQYEYADWMKNVVDGTPGQPIGMPAVHKAIRAGGLSSSVKEAHVASLKALHAAGQVTGIEDFTSHLLSQGSGWLFVHNAAFESRQLAAGIQDHVWDKAVSEGRISGAPNYKNLRASWDPELDKLRDLARGIERADKPDWQAAGKHWTDWYRRARGMMTGEIASPSGLKTVDVMDLARGVLQMAGRADPTLAGPTGGLLSQATLAQMLLGETESHLADMDAQQSARVAGRLMQEGEQWESIIAAQESGEMVHAASLRAGASNLIPRARAAQRVLSWSSLLRDLANRQAVGDLRTSTAVVKQAELAELSPDRIGKYFIGGQEVPAPPVKYFRETAAPEVPMGEYIKHRMKHMGMEMTSEQQDEVVEGILSHGPDFWGAVRANDPGKISEHLLDPMTPIGAAASLDALGDDYHSMRRLTSHYRMLDADVAPPKDFHEALSSAWTGTKAVMSESWEQTKLLWKGLTPKTQKGVMIGGAVVASLGVLGMIRGRFEKERDAQPVSVDLEEYLAQGQVHRAEQEEEARRAGSRTAMEAPRLQKNPGRYY